MKIISPCPFFANWAFQPSPSLPQSASVVWQSLKRIAKLLQRIMTSLGNLFARKRPTKNCDLSDNLPEKPRRFERASKVKIPQEGSKTPCFLSTPPKNPPLNQQHHRENGFTTPPRRIISPPMTPMSTPEKTAVSPSLSKARRRRIEAGVRRLFAEDSLPQVPQRPSEVIPKQIIVNGWDELLEWNSDR